MRVIEFVDGNTNEVVSRRPFEEVPEPNRQVYLRDGVQVATQEESDQVVAIARVVKLALDEQGQPVPVNLASKILIREYDDDGVLRRESLMQRPQT